MFFLTLRTAIGVVAFLVIAEASVYAMQRNVNKPINFIDSIKKDKVAAPHMPSDTLLWAILDGVAQINTRQYISEMRRSLLWGDNGTLNKGVVSCKNVLANTSVLLLKTSQMTEGLLLIFSQSRERFCEKCCNVHLNFSENGGFFVIELHAMCHIRASDELRCACCCGRKFRGY